MEEGLEGDSIKLRENILVRFLDVKELWFFESFKHPYCNQKHGHRKSKADFQHSLQSKEENKPSEISQYVQPSNDYTAGNYMGMLLICDQPLRQHPRKVIRSIRSKYRSSHNNNSSSSHSNKTIATIICTIKVSSNPLLMLRLLVGQRQLLLHLRPLELRLHLFCTNLKFRIPHLPLQCLSKEW